MIRTLNRRFPALRILIYPVTVQGSGAAEKIAGALNDLDKQRETLDGVDLIILGRGGGSLEDLWAFNEEIVARAIYACQIPIISAVGHEIDVTIADMVADVRAATPTAGAELAVPVLSDILESLLVHRQRLGRFLGQKVEFCQGKLEKVLAASFFRQPLGLVMSQTQRLDELTIRADKAVGKRLADSARQVNQLERRLSRLAPRATLARAEGQTKTTAQWLRRAIEGNIHRAQRNIHQRILRLAQESPRQMVGLKRAGLKATGYRLGRAVNVVNNTQAKRLDAARAQLEAVGPERVLARGYSVTMQAETGELVRDVKQLAGGQELLTRLHKGKIYSTVNKTKED
jgi:exodeoxyribonuclease VII large subunit